MPAARMTVEEPAVTQVKTASAEPAGLDSETVLQAAQALLSYLSRTRGKESVLGASSGTGEDVEQADEDDSANSDAVDIGDGGETFVSLQLVLKRAPERATLKPRAIPLTHGLYQDGVDDVCFIVKDPQRTIKDHLAERDVRSVTKVLGVSKLRKRYGTYEGRRELCQQYDMFIADDRVMPMLPRLLGNVFIRSKKMPLLIRMEKDIPRAIDLALRSTTLCPGSGTTCTVRIAKTRMTPTEIAENVTTAMSTIVRTLGKGKWTTFQAIYLKTTDSPALPIFVTVPTAADFGKRPSKRLRPVDTDASNAEEERIVDTEKHDLTEQRKVTGKKRQQMASQGLLRERDGPKTKKRKPSSDRSDQKSTQSSHAKKATNEGGSVRRHSEKSTKSSPKTSANPSKKSSEATSSGKKAKPAQRPLVVEKKLTGSRKKSTRTL